MPHPRPRLSVFPKCYFDVLCRGEMVYLDWIRAAATLGAEGLEHYDRSGTVLSTSPIRTTLIAVIFPERCDTMMAAVDRTDCMDTCYENRVSAARAGTVPSAPISTGL